MLLLDFAIFDLDYSSHKQSDLALGAIILTLGTSIRTFKRYNIP